FGIDVAQQLARAAEAGEACILYAGARRMASALEHHHPRTWMLAAVMPGGEQARDARPDHRQVVFPSECRMLPNALHQPWPAHQVGRCAKVVLNCGFVRPAPASLPCMAVFPLPHLLRAFSLLLLIMAALGAHAQIDNVYVYGTVKDYNTSKRLDGITVSVYKDGALHSSVVTSANGKYEFNLDYGYEYKLLFDKPGMVGKNVVINTRQTPEEERIGGLAMNVEMTLFQDIAGIDYSLLQQPIGKSKYDPSTNMLAWDLEYTEQMRAELNRLQKEYDDKKKREASADAAFDKLMDQGIAAMASKDYRKAVQHFTDALGLKAGDPIATAKLSDARIKVNELDQA